MFQRQLVNVNSKNYNAKICHMIPRLVFMFVDDMSLKLITSAATDYVDGRSFYRLHLYG